MKKFKLRNLISNRQYTNLKKNELFKLLVQIKKEKICIS